MLLALFQGNNAPVFQGKFVNLFPQELQARGVILYNDNSVGLLQNKFPNSNVPMFQAKNVQQLTNRNVPMFQHRNVELLWNRSVEDQVLPTTLMMD